MVDNRFRKRMRSSGSRPVVGSSTTIIFGSLIRACAIPQSAFHTSRKFIGIPVAGFEQANFLQHFFNCCLAFLAVFSFLLNGQHNLKTHMFLTSKKNENPEVNNLTLNEFRGGFLLNPKTINGHFPIAWFH